MRRVATLFLFATIPLSAPLGAQSAAAASRRDPVMGAFDDFAFLFGSRLVAAFDSIPASRYGYRPMPPQQSIGYIAQHLEDANYSLCERIGGSVPARTAKDSLADTVKAGWPKDTLVARLRASLDFCRAALLRVDKLESTAKTRTLLAFETDLAEHYSQLSGYMRQLGMVPPSALPPRARVASDVPATVLKPYVGVYQLDPEIQLDVTMRDGALSLQSTGGRTLRLWAESERDFFLKEVDAQVTFVRDANGAVTSLVVHQMGRDRTAIKLR